MEHVRHHAGENRMRPQAPLDDHAAVAALALAVRPDSGYVDGSADGQGPPAGLPVDPLAQAERARALQPLDRLQADVGDGVVGTQLGLAVQVRSEEHTSELQSLMRISYAVFCL